ncbi:hypothetical protein S83_054619, partial [Arachis hypogaea]
NHFIFLSPLWRDNNFHVVLRVVISLEEEFFQQPFVIIVPSEILRSNRFYPYFK